MSNVWSGLLLIGVGSWMLCQVWGGKALLRLKVVEEIK